MSLGAAAGDTCPLHVACWTGDYDRVVELVELGEDVDKPDRYQRTPLHCACVNGHLNIVRFLLDKKVPISEKDHYGRTPLHCLAGGGHVSTIQLVLKKAKLSEIQERDGSGRTALEIAKAKGYEQVARAIRQALRERGDVGDDDGESLTPSDRTPTELRFLPPPVIRPRSASLTTPTRRLVSVSPGPSQPRDRSRG